MRRSEAMVPASLLSHEEKRRLAETMRKRRYRAGKRNELNQLKAEARRLATYLSELKAPQSKSGQLENLEAENSSLQAKLNHLQNLVQALSYWANVNEAPQKGLSYQPAITTLFAHPITRRQGIQWLSERVYHEACRVLPLTHPYRGQIEDAMSLDVFLSEDIDEEGATIAGIETKCQYTVCTNFENAAQCSWENSIGTSPDSPVSRMLIDKVDDRFMYFHHTNSRIGTNALTIAGLFKEANRVVVTNCFVANDELFPLGNGLQRPHGFSWTVYQSVAPDITLIYNHAFQYTPLSANGRPIPLERIGELFGLSPQGVQHRTTFIEQIRSAAEAAYIHSSRIIIRELTTEMEATSTFVEPPSEETSG
ncbi:hypothetical protein AC1031_014390 [Aphanomyces cochlioides]|nr:hypothetical protein AC1031_014390 [Aphanomyces cochlioides]